MGISIIGIFATILGLALLVVCAVYLVVPIFKAMGAFIAWIFRAIGATVMHFARFIGGMLGDSLRIVGAVLTCVLLSPMVVLNIVIGRWSAARHFGNAWQGELRTAGACLYRVAIGHPARFLLLGGLTEGIEQRLPQAVAGAPGSDRPSKRTGLFDGYNIVGSMKGGGSGGRLYVAEPTETKLAQLERSGFAKVGQVVIKAFSLHDGSSLPQIIRESRALEAAKKIGLVLEHELTDERFFYVMPYVPGDQLGQVTADLHARSPEGLRGDSLRWALSLAGDLLETLEQYHTAGLWHKDIKPDNIIVNASGAHLVDLGLVTPLRSAMTLTTHGTEYFRDPELVRMALRGAKVHEVDGVKFDLYGAGAVLFSMIENSFPAHGGLSQIGKDCPDALRWVVRRAMAETHQRYTSAAEMLGDLRVIERAEDAFALKPKDLPSVKGLSAADVAAKAGPEAEKFEPLGASAGTTPPPPPPPAPGAAVAFGGGEGARSHGGARKKPEIRLADWWTGRYEVRGGEESVGGGVSVSPPAFMAGSLKPVAASERRDAKTQLRSAQARARAAQKRAAQRRGSMRSSRFDSKPNRSVVGAVIAFFLVAFVLVPMIVAMLMPAAMPMIRSNASGMELVIDGDTVTVEGMNGSVGELRSRLDGREMVLVDGVPTPVLQGSAGRLLMLHDGQAVFDGATQRLLDTFVEAGFELVGRGQGETDNESLARIIRLIGYGAEPSDEMSLEAVQDWLIDESDDAYDGVLWIVPARRKLDRPEVRLITRDADEEARMFLRLHSQNAIDLEEERRAVGVRGVASPSVPELPAPPAVLEFRGWDGDRDASWPIAI